MSVEVDRPLVVVSGDTHVWPRLVEDVRTYRPAGYLDHPRRRRTDRGPALADLTEPIDQIPGEASRLGAPLRRDVELKATCRWTAKSDRL